ncbi:MAG: FAD binding domain-containing protein [Xanthobacteraceae bacterium]
MKPFEYVAAEDSSRAVALLAEYGANARILAGGTDLLVDLKSALHAPGVVIDISRAADLKGIAITEAGLRIGALVTHSEIMRSPLIKDMFPVLVEAAHSIGAVQTRNLGTLGGNLAACLPCMDSGPALIVLEAIVTIAGPSGRRQLPLAELFSGPRKTSLAPGELLVEIIIPKHNFGRPAAFQKFGLRKGQALALVNAAASFWIDRDSATVRAPRIALGAVAPTVIRAPQAEAYLEGHAVTAEAMAESGRIAATEAKPISDFRASADYRRELVAVLVKRALASAYARSCAKLKERGP